MTDLFRTSIDIAAPPREVFRFWTDPELLASWLGMSAQLDARPGGMFRFEVAPGEWCAGEFVRVEPPNRLVMTWGWESGRIDLPPGSSRVEVRFEPIVGGTRLHLRHSGLHDDILRLHADGWPRFLQHLTDVVAGPGPGRPPWSETPEQALKRLGSA